MRPYDKYFPSKIYISNNGNKIQNKESKIQLKLSLSQAGYTSHSGQYGCHFLCDTPDYPVTTNNILCPINWITAVYHQEYIYSKFRIVW